MSYFSLFQSPHPVRGATGSRSCWPPSQCHFNPRTPRGVRLAPHAGGGAAILISIHAPREGCDTINQLRMAFQIQFQSTHPARGATSNDKRLEADELLFQSTHPARGATVCRRATMDVFTCFNPRTPRGVRPRRSAKPSWPLPFQSTHPARGATEIGFDDFTYAFYEESKDLPDEKKKMLLEMARFMKADIEKEKG